MILNFFEFFLFVLFIYCNGIFFEKVLITNLYKIKEKFFFDETILLSIFFICLITLFVNFFFPIKNLIIIFVIFSLIGFGFYLKNFKIKILYIIAGISLVFTPFALTLPAGYDAGLYHLPHQLIIREEKIIFGLTAEHDRYGIISILNYIRANFWLENSFNLVAYFGALIYAIFFSYIYRNIKLNSHLNLLFISSLFTFGIWSRYSEASYGLVDAPYAIFFTIFFFEILKIFEDNKFRNNKIILIILIYFSFVSVIKPSGFVIFVMFVILFFCFFKDIKKNIKKNIILCLFPFLLSIFWIIKNFINSSCLIYPISFTCLETSWLDYNDVLNVMASVQRWAELPIKSIGNIYIIFLNFFKFFLFFIPIILLIFFFKKKINLANKKLYLFYFINIIIIIILSFQYQSLKGIYYNIAQQNSLNVSSIFKKEIIFLVITYGLALINLFLAYIFCNRNYKFNYNLKNKKILPFIFLFICIIIWLVKAPNPRFGMSYFSTILSSILFFIFLNNYNNEKGKKIILINKLFIFFLIFKISFIDIDFKKHFDTKQLYKKISEPIDISNNQKNFLKRKNYGFKPSDETIDKCWIKKNCYSGKYDIKYEQIFLNYKKVVKSE